jgi:hypothetical protein
MGTVSRLLYLAMKDRGEMLVADIEGHGDRIVEIVVCDVSDISPDSALWRTGVLGPKPATIQALGSVAGESSIH